MKNLVKQFLVAAVLLTTVVTTAMNDDPSVKINSVSAKLVNLTLNNFDKAIKFSIKDNEGLVLYSETFEKEVFSKKFNLATLPVGNYYFEIDSYTKIKTIPVYVDAVKVILNENNSTVYFKPMVRLSNNTVLISKLSLNNAPLKVVMYDQNFNVIYMDEISGSKNLEKKLDVSELPQGTYNLLLSSENKTVLETFTK